MRALPDQSSFVANPTINYVSRKQAATILSCSDQTVSKLIKSGQLPAYHLGRAVRIKLSDLNAALEVYSK
jgi:excisionase family DNA binding protein